MYVYLETEYLSVHFDMFILEKEDMFVYMKI